MHRFERSIATVAALLSLGGCSSSPEAAPADAGDEGIVPPNRPGGPTTTAATRHAYAIHRVYLGATDRSVPPVTTPTAWESYGYDLDGKATTALSTDVCSLSAGAASATQDDGVDGIDDSFGENLAPPLSVDQGSTDDEISVGMYSTLFVVDGWDDSNAAQTATGLTGVVLAAEGLNRTPTWTTADHWPIDDTYVAPSMPGTDPVGGATSKIAGAYVLEGEFVSGSPTDVAIRVGFAGPPLPLVIHHATVTWRNNGVGHVTQGTIAGVLDVDEVVASVMENIGADLHWTPVDCASGPWAGIQQVIERSADILHDGTNRAGVQCDAISIGIGFDADEVAIPVAADVVGPPMPNPGPCAPDGGAGG
jgi:hypothetical protein